MSNTPFETWKAGVEASGYTPGILPRSEVGILPAWAVSTSPFPQSTCHKSTVWSADAGLKGRLEVGLWHSRDDAKIPRGMAARWALILLCRGIKSGKSLVLDESIGDVMRVTGGSQSAGARSARQGLREAIRAILRCGITHTVGGDSRNVSPLQGLQGKNVDSCTDPLRLKTDRLNGLFVKSVEKGVPVDLRALRLLGRDVLAWDLLVFLAWRARSVKKVPLTVRWEWLYSQLGSRRGCGRQFRYAVRQALRKVKVLYPKLKVAVVKDGIFLRPSPPMFKIVEVGKIPGYSSSRQGKASESEPEDDLSSSTLGELSGGDPGLQETIQYLVRKYGAQGVPILQSGAQRRPAVVMVIPETPQGKGAQGGSQCESERAPPENFDRSRFPGIDGDF